MKDYTEQELKEMSTHYWIRKINETLVGLMAVSMVTLVVVVCIFIMLIWKG
jgi:hypothetical protein